MEHTNSCNTKIRQWIKCINYKQPKLMPFLQGDKGLTEIRHSRQEQEPRTSASTKRYR